MSEKQRLREFILENFVTGLDVEEFGDDDSFLEQGIIDSTGVLEMVAFIEETYLFEVDDEEVLPENFDTLDNLDAYIARKRAEGGSPEDGSPEDGSPEAVEAAESGK